MLQAMNSGGSQRAAGSLSDRPVLATGALAFGAMIYELMQGA